MHVTYGKLMRSITKEKIFKGLLAYGLFSDKLPDVFDCGEFYNFCKNNKITFKEVASDYVIFDIVRNINIPRQLGIPTPFSHYFLCKCIADNWDNIVEHFDMCTKNNSHKVSRVHVRNQERSEKIFEMNYKPWKLDGTPSDDLIIGESVVVHTDIASCFNSIYTHAIPWAIIGKANEKSNLKSKNNNLWYDDIDRCCRNTTYGETHGILIGPVTSNVISEIVLVRIDKCLVDKGYRFIRSIDDYECYAENEIRAQEFIRDLSCELRKYNLQLNHKKTKIEKLPQAAVEHWVRKLQGISFFDSNGYVTYNRVKSYLDYAVELSQLHEVNLAIVFYAIKALAGAKDKMSKNAREYVIKDVMHLAYIYPYLLPCMGEFVFDTYVCSLEMIKKYIGLFFREDSKMVHYEPLWISIFYSLEYGFEIDGLNNRWDYYMTIDDVILKLFMWLYAKRYCKKEFCKGLRDEARKIAVTDYERYWIFIYEVLDIDDFNKIGNGGSVKLDNWKLLKEKGISFLKENFR